MKKPVKFIPEIQVPEIKASEQIPTKSKKIVQISEFLATVDGGKVYKKCQACHVKTGEGVPGAFPPLTGRLASLLKSKHGREYLALVVMNGVRGEMNIDGIRYIGTMPRQGGMTPEKTAAVLNYIMTEFNGVATDDTDLFKTDEIVKISTDNGRMTAQNIFKKRATAFVKEQ
ncbi:MAG: cytochrome c [Rhizobiales bacterium]|nr:cytochrome c [Hyphomicrobiales bacterium]